MKHQWFAPLLLVALGLMFLARNFGLLPNLHEFWALWWPLVLIAVGFHIYLRPRRCRNREKSHE